MEVKLLGERGSHQVPDPINGLDDWVVEVVDDRHREPLHQELNRRVASDEPRPAGHQDRLLRGHHCLSYTSMITNQSISQNRLSLERPKERRF